MTMFPEPQTPPFLEDSRIPDEDLAYAAQRVRNQLYSVVMEAFSRRVERGDLTRALLARRIGKKPEQISRWFSGPSNWTVDTIGILLAGVAADLEPRVCFLEEKVPKNYRHELAAVFDDSSPASRKPFGTPSGKDQAGTKAQAVYFLATSER